MIIPGKPIQNILKAYGEQSNTSKSAKADKPGVAQRKDEVILSSEGKEFAQILQSIKNSPDVREDKVKDLSQRIDSGSYRIDSNDVAEKIIKGSLVDNTR